MSGQHFNKLSPAEAERLAMLLEEMGEAQQAIGKILRHGYESHDPTEVVEDGYRPRTNRSQLERELGDVAAAMDMLAAAGDLHAGTIARRTQEKLRTVQRWLHHQPKVNP